MEIALLNMALEKYKRFFRKSYQKSLHNQFFYVKITNCIWIRLWLETHTPGVINEQHVNHEGSFLMPESKLENFVFTVMMAFAMVYAMICYNIALTIGRDEGCCLTWRLPRNDDHVAGCNHPGDVRLWKACRLLDSAADYTWNANLADHLDPLFHYRLPYVPNDELDRNRALQELPSSWLHRDLAADCRHQLSNGDWLANLPLRSCGKILV